MDTFHRIVFWTLVFCHHTWSQQEECNNKLGMESKGIPDDSITSSSQLNSDHSAFFARLDGEKAWCSALGDNSPYIQILLDEEKTITAIETQGSDFDFSWSKRYDVHYWKEGKWSLYKKGLTGNRNIRSPKRNHMKPPIRTRKIRIYPKDPASVMFSTTPKVPCLRLELHGCSAPADCKDPGIPSNGRRIGDNFKHGNDVTFACLPGFALVGNLTSVCRKGRWSYSLPKCKATCKDPGVPKNGKRLGNTFIDGDIVQFSCNANYSLIGTSIIRCLEVRWSSNVPACRASCPDPGVPQNGQRDSSNFGHETKVQFTCNSGFWLVGSRWIVCKEGKWSNDIPKCKAVCSNPGVPRNGKRIGDDFGDGQMVAYRCDLNFDLVGTPTSFCVSGHWNSTRPTCKASCSDPGFPQHGQRIGSNFGHGSKVTFVCLPEYSLEGSHSMVCHDGKWSSVLPVCKAFCMDPGSPQNGARHGNEFGNNKRISFTCLPGFQLIGSVSAVCINGKWSASLPRCKAVCPDPGVPVNGNRIGNSFLDGQTVAFRCQPGHSLIGSQVLRCVAGKWNDDMPECQASCPDPVVPSNGRALDSWSGNRHGERVQFSCDSGFKLEGSSTIRCNNGKWSSPAPLCKDVCPDPGVPVNGNRIGNSFLDGQTVAFRCQPGHSLIGSQVLRCVAGKWNDDMPECKASCPDPVVPSNGRVLDSRSGNRHGERVQFSCDSGFKLEGSSTIRCNNGKWSSPAPLCKDVCPDPGVPVNGNRIGNSFLDGQTVAFRCQPGHSLIGSQVLRCVAGKWNDDMPKCKASCPDPVVPSNGRVLDSRSGNRHGERVQFSCDSGFKLEGSSTIRCNSGKWSSPAPLCKDVCPDPGVPVNGNRIGNSFLDGQTVAFRCQPGHSLIGSQVLRCVAGKWNDDMPECKASCPDPVVPSNGRVLDSRSGNRHGERVQFSCDSGFKLEGSSTIRCNNGKWSSPAPLCKAVCPDPGVPVNGNRIGNSFLDGQTVAFRCQPGHSLIGSQVLRCVAGKWNDDMPKCKAICRDPGIPQHGARQGSDFESGKTVNFTCSAGYTLVGSKTIECRNGIWSSALPQCKTLCKIPSSLNNGVISSNKFDNEGIIELSCHHGYKLIGSAVLRCVSGQWNDSIPQCRKDACSSPPNLAHGSHDGNDFSSGRSVTYSCHAQYVLEGPAVITCVDGQWVGQAPICRAPCPPPRIPTNGFAFGPNLQHESSVQFWCDAGFVLRGLSTSQCNDGQWDSPTPVCEVTCPEPANITNGFYSGNDFSEGSTVNYTCDDEYFLDGSSEITCVNGRWAASPPVCRAPCPAPVPPVNGFVFGENHQHHGTIKFWCKQGFTLRGSEFSQCVNGKWNAPRPTCEGQSTPGSCRKPFVPPNAFMRPSQEWFSHGERMYYWCNPPYSPLGFSIRRCSNGVWSELKFRCNARSCGHPGIPENGKINSYLFTYNSTVEYTCNEGYTRVGSKERICQANQTWSGTKPRCTTLTCGTLPTPANGEKTEESSTSVSFGCIGIRYKLVGSATRTCLEGGQWSGHQSSCQLMLCNDPGTPLNGEKTVRHGFFYSGSVKFSCNNNYKLEGVSRIYCKRDGNWSRSLPRCLAPCSKPSKLQNGRLIGNDFKHDATVSFICSKRYRLVGSKKQTCNNGQWSGVKPRCQPKKRSQGKR